MAETIFSLALIRCKQDQPVGFGGWRERVRRSLSPEMKPLAELVPPGTFGVDLWSLTGPAHTIEEGVEALLAIPPHHLRAEIEFMAVWRGLPASAWDAAPTGSPARHALARAAQASYHALVEPFWDNVRAHLHAERLARGRVLLEGGVEHLLSTLSPRLRWRSPVLEVLLPEEADLHLRGRGLALVPSMFVGDRPVFLEDLSDPAASPRLIFPAARDPLTAANLWSEPDRSSGPLGALIGRTRAAALRRIGDNACTTTELGTDLGVSIAAASQHATVLRRNGLITTRREGGAVLHCLTTLGEELLRVQG
ncbi:MAG TPA: winged helix-turn-helix domain-containing protein [Candidatus Limnocylindrales bacterium]